VNNSKQGKRGNVTFNECSAVGASLVFIAGMNATRRNGKLRR
jgi:hypothetical protein